MKTSAALVLGVCLIISTAILSSAIKYHAQRQLEAAAMTSRNPVLTTLTLANGDRPLAVEVIQKP